MLEKTRKFLISRIVFPGLTHFTTSLQCITAAVATDLLHCPWRPMAAESSFSGFSSVARVAPKTPSGRKGKCFSASAQHGGGQLVMTNRFFSDSRFQLRRRDLFWRLQRWENLQFPFHSQPGVEEVFLGCDVLGGRKTRKTRLLLRFFYPFSGRGWWCG